MKMEPSNFGDCVFCKQKIGRLQTKIFMLHLYLQYIKKGKSLGKNDELSQGETDLKRLTGQTMWIATQIWPNVSFYECRISNTGKSPKVKLLFKANKTLLKLDSTIGSIWFPQLGLNIVCYSDAIDACLEDRSSPSGFIIFVWGKYKRIDSYMLVIKKTWQSNKDSINLKGSCIQWGSWSKCIDSCHAVKEMIAKKEIQSEWIREWEQVADRQTKVGAYSDILRDWLHK